MVTVIDFIDSTGGTTTVSGISNPIPIPNSSDLNPAIGILFTAGSSPVGNIEGTIVDTDEAIASANWEALDGSDITDGLRGISTRMTHIRLNLSSGTTTARILKA